MDDRHKSKDQLIAELNQVRLRNAQLETQLAAGQTAASQADADGAQTLRQENEEKYRTIVDNSLEGIYICQDNILRFCNLRFAQMFGFKDPDDAVGINVEQMVSPKSRELVKRELEARESGKKRISHYNFYALRIDGTEFEVETLGSRILFQGKAAVHGVMRDVSSQKKLERHLRQAQKMEAIGTLAGGIAHDFNNILSVIMGYIELSRDEYADRDKVKRNLENILKATYRAKELVEQILSFSRQTEREKRAIQMNSIVIEVMKLIRASLPSTIRIDREISPLTYVVMGDSTQLHQVVMNLCTNAAHAMQETGGVLTVELSDFNRDLGLNSHDEPPPYLRLTVTDTGCGMTPEMQERIFDPFFTTKKNGEGTGLGLSVVHGIIRNLDGEISIESEPGKGTSFHVFIPLVHTQVPKENKTDDTIPGGTERILLVDDEVTLVNMAHKMLTRLGYDVVPTTDSLEALELFRQQPDSFDLVVTDLTMPDMTGVQLATELLKINPNLPVLLCTGFNRRLGPEEIKNIGIKSVLIKPYSKKEISQTIRRILDEEDK